MKNFTYLFSVLFVFAVTGSGIAQSAFINEVNYLTTNPGEAGFEIAGVAGENLAGWSVIVYNAQGAMQSTESLAGYVIPSQQNGYGTIWYDIDQSSGGGGLALVSPGNIVVQFLSFGGLLPGLVANDGPAAGMNADYIGSQLTGEGPLGQTGTGIDALDFQWIIMATSSPGSVNLDQFFGMLAIQQGGSATAQVATPQLSLSAYPNPVVSTLTLDFTQPLPISGQLRLFDANGRLVTQQIIGVETKQVTLNMQSYASGTYFLQVEAGETYLQHRIVR